MGSLLRIQNIKIRKFLAEFLGTTILLCLGCSANSILQININEGWDKSIMLIAPIPWSLALTVGIYITGGVSGGHLNPAITLGLASIGKFKWSLVLVYFAAQYFGAFLGTTLSYIVYRESFYNDNINNSISIMNVYSTKVIPSINLGTALVDQIIATAFFALIICAILDRNNMNVPKALQPIAIGFMNLNVILFAFGYNCGGPLNPARDLAPRIFASVFFREDFDNERYFWIPIVGCHAGAIIGCWIYKLIIENHWSEEPTLTSYNLTNVDGGGGGGGGGGYDRQNKCSVHITSD